MRESLDFKSPVNKAEFYRPFQKNLPEDLKEDSPSQTAKQATEEGTKLQSQPLELTKQESQLPSQSQSQLKNDIIDDLYFQIIKEKVAKDKHKYEFNELGIWHKNKIKYLGSEEFFQKISDWNSCNPEELTKDQRTKTTEQRDELIKLFTDRKITNSEKEDSPSKEAIQPTKDYTEFESYRSVLKEQELQPLSQSEEKIGNLYFQLIMERAANDKNKTELESLKNWHKDIITYLGSNEFLDKLREWNPHNPEKLILNQRDGLIDLLTYRKITITQPSDEARPEVPPSREDKSSPNRVVVPQSSIQKSGLIKTNFNTNQGSRNL